MNSGWFMAAFGCIDKESPTCTPIQFIVGFIYTKDFGTEVEGFSCSINEMNDLTIWYILKWFEALI